MMGEALRNSTNTVSRFQMRVDQVNVKKMQSTMKNTSSIIISVQSARWGRRKSQGTRSAMMVPTTRYTAI